jgi:hypothetical protein
MSDLTKYITQFTTINYPRYSYTFPTYSQKIIEPLLKSALYNKKLHQNWRFERIWQDNSLPHPQTDVQMKQIISINTNTQNLLFSYVEYTFLSKSRIRF